MATTVQQILQSFDALSDPDKHRTAVEILRRVAITPPGDLPEPGLIETADELFRCLDEAEAGNGEH